MEPSEIITALPLSNRASPKQLLTLLIGCGALIVLGGYCTWTVKNYFDEWHRDIISMVVKSGQEMESKVDGITATTEQNRAAIDTIRKYYWSNADQQRWAQQLDKANRQLDKANQLVVPEVPMPSGIR